MSDKATVRRLLREHSESVTSEKMFIAEDQILKLFDTVQDEAACNLAAALARVAQLEEALRMYADPERWYQIDDDMHPVAPNRAWVCPEPMDEWDYARAALEAQP